MNPITVVTVPVRKTAALRVAIPFALCMLLLAASISSATGCPVPVRTFPKDTILVQKQVKSKKCRIKLQPDANNEVLFFSVRGQEAKVYQLFLFDLDGKLVKQANIRNKQMTVVDNIDKGNYLFEVFSNDERIENGQVIIR